MTILDEMQKEPWRFDFFSVMRRLERINRDRPRIGDSAARREEYVTLGQDPYLDFPASNLSRVVPDGQRLKVFVKFLGLLGPQGALPLTTTEESLAGRGFPALPGPVQSSFHSIVLPGLGGRSADRPARPPEGRSFHCLYRLAYWSW
jgi:hypothetical protein